MLKEYATHIDVINIIFILKPKHSTLPATRKKVNSIQAKPGQVFIFHENMRSNIKRDVICEEITHTHKNSTKQNLPKITRDDASWYVCH